MVPSELVIEGTPRPRILPSLYELWAYRGTVAAFAERNIRVKYKQTALGIGWAVIQPLIFMGVFTLALGRAAGVSGGGVNYAAFSLATLVGWTYLQTGLTFGSTAVIASASLIRKVYFPREVPVVAAMIGSGLDLAIGFLLFFALGPILGATVSWTWVLAPLLAIPLAVLGTGVAMMLAAFNVYYRDFRHALPFFIQLWLFASPVAYPLTVIEEQWRIPFAIANPAVGILDSFRLTLTRGQLPDPVLLGIGVAGSLVIVLLGYRIFKGLEPGFADVV